MIDLMKQILIEIDPDVAERLEQIAPGRSRRRSKFIRMAIRWAELPHPIGRRPVLLLSRSPACEYLSKVIVAELTSTIRSIPQEVPLGQREGSTRSSVANLDNLHIVAKRFLGNLIGKVDRGRQHAAV